MGAATSAMARGDVPSLRLRDSPASVSPASPPPSAPAPADDVPDADMCAVCYSVLCHPCQLSNQCNHAFCRLCVFKCSTSAVADVECPLCRAPADPEICDALLPSELQYDATAARTLASKYPAEYAAALGREMQVEACLRERIIPDLPIVNLPGTAVDHSGKPLRPNVTRKNRITLFFSDEAAQKTIVDLTRQMGQASLVKRRRKRVESADARSAPLVGVLFNEVSRHGRRAHGFLARPVSGCKSANRGRTQRVTMDICDEFELVGRIRRDDFTTFAAVEKLVQTPSESRRYFQL